MVLRKVSVEGMHFHSQSSKLCSPPFLVGREERGVAGMLVEGPRLQLVNRLAVPKGTHPSCPAVGARSVCVSRMYVFIICVPIGLRRLIDIWRAKELLLFKGRRLFRGYFLIRMSTRSGCSKLCRAQREIRAGSRRFCHAQIMGGGLGGVCFIHTVWAGLVTGYFGSFISQGFACVLDLSICLSL